MHVFQVKLDSVVVLCDLIVKREITSLRAMRPLYVWATTQVGKLDQISEPLPLLSISVQLDRLVVSNGNSDQLLTWLLIIQRRRKTFDVSSDEVCYPADRLIGCLPFKFYPSVLVLRLFESVKGRPWNNDLRTQKRPLTTTSL
jgi:hypothetical protein